MRNDSTKFALSLTLALLPFTVSRLAAQDGPPPPGQPPLFASADNPNSKPKPDLDGDKPGSNRVEHDRVEVHVGNGPDGRFYSQSGGGGFSQSGGGAGNMNQNFDVFTLAGNGPENDKPLIVSSGNLDEKATANLEEDLAIMGRILEKAVDRGGKGDSPDRQAMGIHLWAINQGHSARNLYLDGYGALFQLHVNMPLVGPPSKEKEKDGERKEPSNSAWDSTRKELYGRRADGDDDDSQKPRFERTGPRFDPNRVDALKENLIESLKNASHIRGLNDDEYVTVVVQAPGSGPIFTRRAGRTFGGGGNNNRNGEPAPAGGGGFGGNTFGGGGGGGFGGGNFFPGGGGGGQVFAFTPGDGPNPGRTLMVLRAKKSDIDAAAKGKSDDEKFRKAVSVRIYQTGGPGPSDEARRR